MILAERCVLLSAEILKSQSKYSEAAALLIRLTSEVTYLVAFSTLAFPLRTYQSSSRLFLNLVLRYFLAEGIKWAVIKHEVKKTIYTGSEEASAFILFLV